MIIRPNMDLYVRSGKFDGALFVLAVFFLCYLQEVLPQNPRLEIQFVDRPEYTLNGSVFELKCMFQYTNNADIVRMKWEISDKSVDQRVGNNGDQLTDDLLTWQPDGTFTGPGSPKMESIQLPDGSFQLSFDNANVKEDEKRYWCVASTFSLGADDGYYDSLVSVPPNPDTGIKLSVNNNPITDDKIQVSDSEPYTFKCETVGTKPAANITWSIDGETYAGSQTDEETAESLWDSVNILENLEFTKFANLQLNVFVPASDVSQRSVSLEFQGQRRNLTTGALVGIIVGIVVLLLACVGGAVGVYMKSQKSKGRVAETDEEKQSKEKDSLQESKDSESHTEQEDETTLDKN